ncbi:hypothetical protein B0H12DRAFT_222608 [Mycena haematopus]|nr:hypothetical protein B0H12DRAFT_222608 [Mycena haematopus]
MREPPPDFGYSLSAQPANLVLSPASSSCSRPVAPGLARHHGLPACANKTFSATLLRMKDPSVQSAVYYCWLSHSLSFLAAVDGISHKIHVDTFGTAD